MKVINRKEINSKDWKNFINWSDEGKFLFKNTNFFSQFFSINRDFELEDNIIEFYLFNTFILKDRYSIEWPDWLKNNRGSTIEETIRNLFKEFLKEEPWNKFIEFYFNLIYYLVTPSKNSNTEYELALEYNLFIKELKTLNNNEYNNWIEYINKNIHMNLKGYKR